MFTWAVDIPLSLFAQQIVPEVKVVHSVDPYSLQPYKTHSIIYYEGICTGEFDSNIIDCSLQCRTQLEEIKSTLGCCINVLASKCKWYRYVYFPSLDYRLWNSCGVPLPPMDCEHHGLPFNVPATIQNNCTIVDEYIVEGTKEFQFVQILLKHLLDDRRFSQVSFNTAKNSVDTCSVKDDGKFCFQSELHHYTIITELQL